MLLKNDNEVLDLIGSSLTVDEGDGGRLDVSYVVVKLVLGVVQWSVEICVPD